MLNTVLAIINPSVRPSVRLSVLSVGISLKELRGQVPGGPKAGVGFLERGSEPPPHQLGGLALPVGSPPATNRFFAFWCAQNGSPVAFN